MRRRRQQENTFLNSIVRFGKEFLAQPLFIGIDLGSSQVRIYLENRGIILKEKTYVVQNIKNRDFVSFGDEAYDMLGKTPPNLKVFSPIEQGRVSDFDAVVYLLKQILDRALSPYKKNRFLNRFVSVFSVPLGLTEVEEMAIVEVGKKVGAREVYLVETPLAAGFGTKMPVMENIGTMLVDIGGGTTEVSLVSLGGIVLYKVLKVGGRDFNSALLNYLRLRYGLLAGEKSIEEIKHNLGSIFEKNDRVLEVSGQSIETGMPKTISVKAHLLYEALYPYFGQILEAIRESIEETPPELIKDVKHQGVLLSGMASQCKDLYRYFSKELGLDVRQVEEPEYSVIRGLGWLIEHREVLRKIAISFSRTS